MMDFEQRLQKAIDRGKRTKEQVQQTQSAQATTEEEFKALHSSARLELTDHIEACLRKLIDHFPGFEFETIIDETGWGARIRRDDIHMKRGNADRLYSQLVMLIRPFSSGHLIDLLAKATIRNKELFARNHFQRLVELDLDSFSNLIDLWVLEFAEGYSAQE
ncbi:MAG TPA: hypothetical protein DIW81_16880 [Planctomycetaceae bacterium]|nr:hypothetical protein [Rubinisphaera sp.]HCS53241.1 hypothetical protein [Planctomycetaceae bacterium]